MTKPQNCLRIHKYIHTNNQEVFGNLRKQPHVSTQLYLRMAIDALFPSKDLCEAYIPFLFGQSFKTWHICLQWKH